MVPLLLACTPVQDTGSPPTETAGVQDSAEPEVFAHTLGDPITSRIWREETAFLELYVVEAISPTRGLVTGVEGLVLYDQDGGIVDHKPVDQVWAMAADPDVIVIGQSRYTTNQELSVWAIQNDQMSKHTSRLWDARPTHMDFAGDHILVVDLEGNLSFLNFDLQRTGTSALSGVQSAVFIDADTVAVGHDRNLSLVDRSSGAVLDSWELQGVPRDVSYDDGNLVVALGGEGIEAFRNTGDGWVHRGHLRHSALRVSVDGDDAWLASWDAVGLVWLGEGGPIQVGQETPGSAAMDVGAMDGRAWVGDWFGVGVVDRHPGLTGPELDMPRAITGPSGGTSPLVAFNTGSMDLEITVAGQTWTIEPGGMGRFDLEMGDSLGEVSFTSNDLDESQGVISLWPSTLSVGSPHPDFLLQSFDPTRSDPSTPWALSENLQKPVFLVFWAEY